MAKPKLKLGYDNIEDAKIKLLNTFCLYKGKAIVIKGLDYMPGHPVDAHKFYVMATPITRGAKINAPEGLIALDDPDFNCSEFNLGYMNTEGFCTWWYRIPQKQYSQGLRTNQVTCRASNQAYLQMADFKSGNYLAAMLENIYPTYKDVVDRLKQKHANVVAFHRNFALSHDQIHGDFIVEYKGEQIGFTPNLEDFKLMREHEHLYEALKEAIGG